MKKSFDLFLLYLYCRYFLNLEVLYKRSFSTKGAAQTSNHWVFKRVDDPSSPTKCTIFPVKPHSYTSQGVISPEDKNPPNPDRNDLTFSQADDSSAETEYLENLTQKHKTTGKRGPTISEGI